MYIKRARLLRNRKGRNRGTSAMEFLLINASVLAFLIAFLGPNGIFKRSFRSTFNTVTDSMEECAGRLATSRDLPFCPVPDPFASPSASSTTTQLPCTPLPVTSSTASFP